MSLNQRTRRQRSGAYQSILLLTLLTGLALMASGGAASAADDAHGEETAQEAPTPTGPVLVAGSICEAHELRTKKERDPRVRIEIPAEFDKQWPSAKACASAKAASDPVAEGPLQPIEFSHKHHAGDFGIDCQYCHSNTGKSRAAGVPSVELCMGCHAQFPKEYDEIAGIRVLKEHWEEKKPIEWVQIHRLPEHVKFRHNRHVQAGVDCQRCHGPVEAMDKLYLTPDENWKYFVPSQKLEMGWCINCHRQNNNQASIDCVKCHY